MKSMSVVNTGHSNDMFILIMDHTFDCSMYHVPCTYPRKIQRDFHFTEAFEAQPHIYTECANMKLEIPIELVYQ